MSRNLDLLEAAYQRAGRDGVAAIVDLLDPKVEWLAATPGPGNVAVRGPLSMRASAR
jgi:hypothetical protein